MKGLDELIEEYINGITFVSTMHGIDAIAVKAIICDFLAWIFKHHGFMMISPAKD